MPLPRRIVECQRGLLNGEGSDVGENYCVALKASEFEEFELPSGSTASVFGVLTEDAPSTGSGADVRRNVQTKGMATIVAGAAVAIGALVMPTSAGKVITRTGTNSIVGEAKTAASADGDVIEVELKLQVGA